MTFVNAITPPQRLPSLLALHPLFQELPPEALRHLCQHALERTCAPEEVVFHEGDPALHWFLIETGHIELVRYCCEGNERIYHRYTAGQCLAETAMFMAHRRYPMQARAATRAVVWRLDRQALHQASSHYPPLALRLLEDFGRRIYHYINEVEWLTVSSAPQRLAGFLLGLAHQQQGHQLELPGSQRQLAAQLGIRPETLSRLFAQWQAKQWLHGERRHWTLLNTTALHQLTATRVRSF